MDSALLETIAGYAIVLGGAICKLPQLWVLWRDRRSDGLAPWPFAMELAAALLLAETGLVARRSFSLWGENLFIAVALLAVLGMVRHYAKPAEIELPPRDWRLIWVGLAFSVLMLSPVWDPALAMLAAFSAVLGIVAVAWRIVGVYRDQGTAQLSMGMVGLQCVGCAVRLATLALQLPWSDPLVEANAPAVVLNGVLLGALVHRRWWVGGDAPMMGILEVKHAV